MCAFTPLKGLTGLVEKFWDLPGHPDADEDVHGPKLKHDATNKWLMVRATWEDIGHMTEESKRTQRAGMMEYEIATRTMGVPMSGEGRIYPHNTTDIIFTDETDIPVNADHLIGIDFGFTRDPAAAVHVRYDQKTDVIWVVGNWKQNISHLREHAQGIWSLNPYCTVAWPRDGNNLNDFRGGATTASTLRDEFGVMLLPEPFMNPVGADGRKNNHLSPGFSEINSRFADGRLKIHVDCDELLHEFNNYSYDSNGKPMKGSEDHLLDAFRYAVMSVIQGIGTQPAGKAQFWYDNNDDGNDDYYYNSY